MPKVPQLTPQIQSAPMPNIRVSEDISREAANIGASAQARDRTIYDIAEKAKNSADQIAVADAENELIKFENDFQYNPKTGMYRKEGKDAFDLIEVSREEYAKKKSAISKDYLKNDVQRSAFNERATRREEQFNKETMNHVGVQIKKYDDDVTKSSIELEHNKAINGYQDPATIALAIANQKKALMDYSNRHGESTEMATLRAQSAESKVHYGVVSRMLTNGDDLSADAYFKANKENIKDADDLKRAEAELEIGSTRGYAQRFTDDMVKKGYDETRAYKEAANIENPKKREAAEARIDRVFGLKRQAEQRAQQDTLDNLTNYFDQNGNIDDPKFIPLIRSLDDNSKQSLANYMNRNPMRDDGKMYYKLKTLAEDPKTRSDFMNKDLTKPEFWGNLSKEHREELLTVQRDLKNKKGGADKKLDGIYSDSQVVKNEYLTAMFPGENLLNQGKRLLINETNPAFIKYKTEVDKEVERVKRQEDRTFLSNEEIRNISKRFLKDVVTEKGWFYDTKKKPFQVEFDDIPSADLEKIKKGLKDSGVDPTDDNVLKYYIMEKSK